MFARQILQLFRNVVEWSVHGHGVLSFGRAFAAGALVLLALVSLGCSNAEEVPSGFIMDSRGVAPDLSGLQVGPIVVEFDIYAYGNAEFSSIEQMPGGPFLLGKVGVGRLKPPQVKLEPVLGFPKARRLTATFDAGTPGTYLLESGLSFDRSSPALHGLAPNEFKDADSWPEPTGFLTKKYWTPFPLYRTVGSCRHPSVITTIVSPAKDPGWYIEWSEPFAPGTDLPPFVAAPAKRADDMVGTVKPLLVAGSDRIVFVPAPGGKLVFSGTAQAWDIPKSIGAKLEVAGDCAPAEFKLPLPTEHQLYTRERLSLLSGEDYNKTLYSDLISEKASKAKVP